MERSFFASLTLGLARSPEEELMPLNKDGCRRKKHAGIRICKKKVPLTAGHSMQ